MGAEGVDVEFLTVRLWLLTSRSLPAIADAAAADDLIALIDT